MAQGLLHWLVQLYVAFVGFYLSDPVQTFVLAYWSILQIVLAAIAVLIFVISAEDLLIDVVYWVLTLLFPRPQPSLAALCAKPESNIAVLIPAWREAGVIGRMLLNMTGTFAYERYHIFVGVYANDAETRMEVDRAASQSRRVHRVQIPHDGPTNKADCLNGLIRAVIAFEAERERWALTEFVPSEEMGAIAIPEEVPLPEGGWFIDAPVAGNLWKVLANSGDQVQPNQPVAIVESMKMEMQVCATRIGMVQSILGKESSQVSQGQHLFIMVPA